MTRTSTVRKWWTWALLAVVVVSVITWYVTRDTLPRRIRLAAAMPRGLYQEFAESFKERIENRSRVEVEIKGTSGSKENRRLLMSGDVNLAIIQAGAVSTEELAVVAPLYDELVHVIVRNRDSGREQLDSIAALEGATVAVGLEDSGMAESARQILEHYEVRPVERLEHFTKLATDATLDAAIATIGLGSEAVAALLGDGEFSLLAVRDGDALGIKHAYFRSVVVPQGLYSENEVVVPDRPLPTVATRALLVTRIGAPDALVTEVLDTLYQGALQEAFPILIPREDAASTAPSHLHPAARRYFYPEDEIGRLGAIMESLAAIKELLVALAAGLFLLWGRWRRLQEKENQLQLDAQKERLNRFLEKTMEIERAQMDTTDIDELEAFLDEITRIKLTALDELTHEQLRSDRMLLIFLVQCANLISKIQLKISRWASLRDAATPADLPPE